MFQLTTGELNEEDIRERIRQSPSLQWKVQNIKKKLSP